LLQSDSAVKSVIPAQAGIQVLLNLLRIRKMDAGLRRHDEATFFWNARDVDYLLDLYKVKLEDLVGR
jgi:hypothetical protein